MRNAFRRKAVTPVHPRDRHWYAVGMKHGNDRRRKGPKFPLQEPTHKGASYYARYKDMYEAGYAAARKGKE